MKRPDHAKQINLMCNLADAIGNPSLLESIIEGASVDEINDANREKRFELDDRFADERRFDDVNFTREDSP